MPLPSADELEQLEDIEKQWAVKAMHHAETYFKLISSIDGSKLRLTGIDDEIYDDFQQSFPEIDVLHLDEKHFKTPEYKEKWRTWINKYEKRVNEFNFGSLIRIDAREDYTEQNTMFGVRMQFYAVEIARNKKGLNDALRNKN
ncbi:putative polysaccharide biosynthesis protein [Radiomyces spectabilis]|uniref:putative polysaccharide biosynthesis protein n=1 Tax=Radiomyces spectabilis TaxID=64574 RepID=UPI002220918E|nr:putative polysaccharide biosynthesis protein [Radiomyces spectabilis]KAI8371459.1 putative polysaccharide biosynthesis protein [Radiomyces spectabilis]